MNKRDNITDAEVIQKLIDDMHALEMDDFTREAGGEVKDCEYEGITSRVKDQQRARNMSFYEYGEMLGKEKKFNEWFDNYSFGYVPSFAKPLIKQWVKAAYLAALGEVK